MKLEDLQIIPFSIPFKYPLKTSRHIYNSRKGFIVKIFSDGITGVGESSPLPGFSHETPEECFSVLNMVSGQIKGSPLDHRILDQVRKSADRSPSTVFGLETAVYDLLSKAVSQPLAVYLNKKANQFLTVNSLYFPEEEINAGFSTVKVKIGGRSLSEDIEFITAVTSKLDPGVKLRLDVNGAWDLKTARAACLKLNRMNIDYIEQPLSPDDINLYSELREFTPIPIALDESLTDIHSAREAIERKAGDVFVIKPMISGGFAATRDILDLAASHKIRSVITSSLESSIGRMALLHMACAYQINEPCGLMTGRYFEQNLQDIPLVNGDKMYYSQSPGLGLDDEIIEY